MSELPLGRVVRTLPVDTLTPLSALLRLRGQARQPVFLFESAGSDLNQARYSFLGLNPSEKWILQDGVLRCERQGLREVVPGPPLETLRNRLQARLEPDPDLPPFVGGYVGYLGYDIVSQLEAIVLPDAASSLPEACLMRFDQVLVFDHLKQRLVWVAHYQGEGQAAAEAELDALTDRLSQPVAEEALLRLSTQAEHPVIPPGTMGPERFCAGVKHLQNALYEGEIFQAVLSEQFRQSVHVDPFKLYRVLRSLNPSPYLFYLDTGEFVLLGASPELLLKSDGQRIATCPIAGTRPRGGTAAQDAVLAAELLADVKERAEHLMLVDLGRNDLGRVARPGSVQVSRYMELEYFSHVMHLVSLVEAELAPDYTAWDALLACFPAGTLSGAPKIRAMQLLAELEPVRRGWYGGAVFYHGFDGQLDACITIRSMAIKDGTAILQAGAGVVADSVPEHEYEEVCNKVGVLFQALALAEEVNHAVAH